MMALTRSSRESQNTSLSTWNESCWTFLSRKSNQRLFAECARGVRERPERESPWDGLDQMELVLVWS